VNIRTIAFLFGIVFTLFCVPSCSTNIAGIEKPIVVNGVDLLFSRMSKINTLISGLEVNPGGEIVATSIMPMSPYDTWIMLEASTKYSGNKDICSWLKGKSVKLGSIRNSQPIEMNYFDCASDYEEGFVRIYFPGYKTGMTDVVLHLSSGKEVPLESLIY
jgi:hypothetical protein